MCLVALIGAIFPRAMLALAYVTGFVDDALPRGTLVWAILGFIVAPTTFVWYCAVQNWFDGRWGVVPLAGLVLAVMLDFRAGGRGAYEVRRRRRHVEPIPAR
jgi:hypothetical protein